MSYYTDPRICARNFGHERLERLARFYTSKFPEDEFVKLRMERRLTKDFPERLVENGWEMEFADLRRYDGLCLIKKKKIIINKKLRGFCLEGTLAHEAVHAWYGRPTIDIGIGQLPYLRGAMVELLARKIVAKRSLISNLMQVFGVSKTQEHLYRKGWREHFPISTFPENL